MEIKAPAKNQTCVRIIPRHHVLWESHTFSTALSVGSATQRYLNVLTCLFNFDTRWGKRNVGVFFPLHSVKNMRSLTFHFGSLYGRDPAQSYWLPLRGFRTTGKGHSTSVMCADCLFEVVEDCLKGSQLHEVLGRVKSCTWISGISPL